ncbi:Succinyl-CoA ligase [ADP-forming] subunit beta [Gemmata obscuriglobus]|uniref:Succinate--CoA ligase [ADP-forming] subunit beta n=1 Tax=Gemmata obscuriglobus TaxID=114 RepID=A0A2Z3HBU3_9BACT|nr:ADP-forming succinate--CoA ligase subunit beta [Gemmata obscuriglobus]AWM40445.1 ADP-forming succinate--CoA ligase subunit beta [Gemmata obscuriglobus]QEG26313.1 Succinyl-CoA ligase [ADP-forming] subunit beta [Gemmata obscuriglobus]VTS01228.1 succinyl- ligase : Succinyl-CoA ligase [ADP-forming] subunit beta OS=Rhodopirellula sallentina SM41 GN=sucC PE=3 SV=1: ATP-grasp_2: Ligase_CoA [Gemmata obscuriglobus UQM 2246]
MKVHEYQAKELLAAAGANVPKHIVCKTPDEVAAAFDKLANGGGVMVKAQIHAGGRGAGQLVGYADKLGGVKFCASKEKARAVAETMLKHPLKTLQTGPDGQPIRTLIVQADAEPAQEFYVAVVFDRAIGQPILMASAAGGMDIEKVAHDTPELIFKVPFAPETGLEPAQAKETAAKLGLAGEQAAKAEQIMLALSKVYLAKDATLAEVNPLAVTKAGDVVVLDAKFDFDDNALFRHPDVAALRDESEENPAEIRAGKANLNFIQLDGTVACLVNGAGLAMATMDIINYHGKAHGVGPANFLDVGGGVTAAGAVEAFRIILSDPKVKGILVNVFGGIASCATIADALVKAGKEVGFKVPVVVRLEGNEVEKARGILTAAAAELPTLKAAPDLTSAAKLVVELSK